MAHEQNLAVKAKQKNPVKPSGLQTLQRACACGRHSGGGGECAECRKKRLGLQRQAVSESGPDTAPPIVHEVLHSSGRPLDPATRTFMETGFGHDFSKVRVHTDSSAAESARAVNALAYTVGQNVVFNRGYYAPEKNSGRRLLAHELAHTIQQEGHSGPLQRAIPVGAVDDAYEREADHLADAVSHGVQQPAIQPRSIHPAIQRACRGGSWEFEYDGCSLPDFVVNTLGIADKDNPAGGSDTHFAHAIPTSAGGVACDRHDECYQTCNPIGKAACDLRMYTDMVSTCLRSSESLTVKASCLAWAETYYAGLRVGGGPAFAQRQAEVCGCALEGVLSPPAPTPVPIPTPTPPPTTTPIPVPSPALPTPTAQCEPGSGAATGERIHMRINTAEFLTPDDQQRLDTFADSLRASGASVRIHGLASQDGPAAYNLTLSCTRAVRIADYLRGRGVASSQIVGLIQHGEVPGPARESRSVILEPIGATTGPGPTPTPSPSPTPTPSPTPAPPAAPSCAIPEDCPSDFCTPYPSISSASLDRDLLAPVLLAGIAAKVSSRVVPIWYQYLYGGAPVQNFSSRFGSDFTDSDTTARTTDFLVDELVSELERNPPVFPSGVNTVTVDIGPRIGTAIRAIGTAGNADEMNFDVIGEIPGNIAGGIGSSQSSCPVGAQPSPIDDARTASGTADVTRNPDGSLTVVPSIIFTVRDTVDLCPGNCGADIEQIATVPMSRFEATGISGDVPYIVEFPAPPRTATTTP